MKRYTHIVLRRMPPLNGFSIKTTEGKFLSDIRPRGIVRELNRLNDRIKQLEEELMDTKNKHAVLVADVALYEDRAERIKQLEDRIHRAAIAFFEDGSDASVASGMLAILEEERGQKP